MKALAVAVALLATVVSGCAPLPGAPVDMTPEAPCARSGGAWRAVLSFCEIQR